MRKLICIALLALTAGLVGASEQQFEVWKDSFNLPLMIAKTAGSGSVNFLVLSNATTTNAPGLKPDGSDANISLNLQSKGTGQILANSVPLATSINIMLPLNATSGAAATDVFVADRNYTVTQIQEEHSVASTGGANVKIRRITDTTAPGAAASATCLELIDATSTTASAILVTGASLNTLTLPAARLLNVTTSVLQINAGDRIAIFPASAMTSYVGCITITMQPR